MPKVVGVSIAAVGLLFGLAQCTQKSAIGFHLPDGNPEEGKQVFVDLGCSSCHQAFGVNFAGPVDKVGPVLGGKHRYTDGQLVTSIIDPNHDITVTKPIGAARDLSGMHPTINGVSRMHDYKNMMTLGEMVDVVAFVHSLQGPRGGS